MTKRALNPGMRRTTLTIDQVKMILRIYWIDKAKRKALGFTRSTYGLRGRLARQYRVTPNIIRNIAFLKRVKYVSVRNEQTKVWDWLKARA
jgi:hypothetical protein